MLDFIVLYAAEILSGMTVVILGITLIVEKRCLFRMLNHE